MLFRSISTIAIGLGVWLAVANSAHAEEEEKREGMVIRPGLYEVTMTQIRGGYVNGKSVEAPPQTASGKTCMKPEGEILKPEVFNQPGCELAIKSIEATRMNYYMTCTLGGQNMRGGFRVQAGSLVDGFAYMKPDDILGLPDGRVASQNFAVIGTLNASQDEVQAWMRTETQYSYAGDCPG